MGVRVRVRYRCAMIEKGWIRSPVVVVVVVVVIAVVVVVLMPPSSLQMERCQNALKRSGDIMDEWHASFSKINKKVEVRPWERDDDENDDDDDDDDDGW